MSIFQSLKSLFLESSEEGFTEEKDKQNIFLEFEDILKMYFKNTVVLNVRPQSIRNETLMVLCKTDYMAIELTKRTSFFVEQLNDRFKSDVVKNIEFIL